MIRFVKHDDIDTEKWDALIKSDPLCLPYAFSWYLDMVSPRWHALIYNDYEAVMPLTHKSKFGLPYLMYPYGTQQLGVFTKKPLTTLLAVDFLKAIPYTYIYVHILLNERTPSELQNQKLAGKFVSRTNYTLNLNTTYQHIYAGFGKTTKRNLKKAQKFNPKIFEYDSPEVLINLFRQEKGEQVKHLTDWHYRKLSQIMHVLIHRNMGFLHTIHDERNQPLAGAFFIRTKHRLIYLLGATSPEGREQHSMLYLMNEFIMFNAQMSYHLDFEGSDLPGVARFFASFGAQKQTYLQYTRRIFGL